MPALAPPPTTLGPTARQAGANAAAVLQATALRLGELLMWRLSEAAVDTDGFVGPPRQRFDDQLHELYRATSAIVEELRRAALVLDDAVERAWMLDVAARQAAAVTPVRPSNR